MPRLRLDQELVRQGFFASADDAMRSVMAGEVSTSGRRLDRPGEQVKPGIELHVRGRAPFVSRGGIKLAAGLDAFGVNPTGCRCLDVGCSTGGFTDCLLRHGAATVVSVDVGYAQFDWSLRQDPRVTLRERTNVIELAERFGAGTFDLAVCDVSFTSVLTIAPAVRAMLESDGQFLTLVKPQFEVERGEVEKGGVVRDEEARWRALQRVSSGLEEMGFSVQGTCDSPIRGHKGNKEYLLLAHAKAM